MSLKPDPKPKGKGLTVAEIESLVEEVKTGIGIALTKAAYNNYVATSFETLANALKVKIIPDEIYEIGKGSEFFKIITKENKVPPLTPSIVSDIKEVYDTPARDYAQAYADDLAKGGRFINKPVWGNYDKDLGYRPYLGYEREWTPWLDTYSEQSKAEITRIIQEGDKAGLWPSRWEGRGPYVDPDDLRWDYPGYEQNSLADQLEGYFSNRRSHASTIARTETQNQRAVVRRERWDQIGYKFFKWVCAGGRGSTNSPCGALCSQFCGKVFSREDLPNNGEKLHPNCVLPDTEVYSPSGFIAATKMKYSGPVVTLNFDSGSVTVTPNHMFLTENGFSAADLLMEGDKVIDCSNFKRSFDSAPDTNEARGAAVDMFNSLCVSSSVPPARVPVSAEYLHNDARFGDENIDIIFSERFLRNNRDATFRKQFCEYFFGARNPAPISFLRGSTLDEFLYSAALSTDGGMSGTRHSSTFFRGRASRTGNLSVGTSTRGYSVSKENFANSSSSTRNAPSNTLFRLPEGVSFNDIVDIDVRSFSGHVYDFQTLSTLYISNGVVNSNCKCLVVAILKRDMKNYTVDSPFPDVSKSDLDSMRREGDKGNAWDIYNPYAIF